MGEIIPDFTHAATLLRNLPKSWRQTARMITTDVDTIEECLEAYKANLRAVEPIDITTPTTAFVARSGQFPGRPLPSKGRAGLIPIEPSQSRAINQGSRQGPQSSFQHPSYFCTNCKTRGHTLDRCYAPGGGSAGRAPWGRQGNYNSSANSSSGCFPITTASSSNGGGYGRGVKQNTDNNLDVKMAASDKEESLMMAKITEESKSKSVEEDLKQIFLYHSRLLLYQI